MSKVGTVATATLLAAVLVLSGCGENKLGGELEVNGQKASIASCRLGQNGDEKWVEVATTDGHRIRIEERIASKSGSTRKETIVILTPSRDATAEEAKCQTRYWTSTNINGRQSGTVSLGNCRTQRLVVTGKLTYGQCA